MMLQNLFLSSLLFLGLINGAYWVKNEFAMNDPIVYQDSNMQLPVAQCD